jgi:hypothetical protein
VVPVVARVEALVRTAVPGVADVRTLCVGEPSASLPLAEDLAARVQRVLDADVNPARRWLSGPCPSS